MASRAKHAQSQTPPPHPPCRSVWLSPPMTPGLLERGAWLSGLAAGTGSWCSSSPENWHAVGTPSFAVDGQPLPWESLEILTEAHTWIVGKGASRWGPQRQSSTGLAQLLASSLAWHAGRVFRLPSQPWKRSFLASGLPLLDRTGRPQSPASNAGQSECPAEPRPSPSRHQLAVESRLPLNKEAHSAILAAGWPQPVSLSTNTLSPA